jgi:hypothetical protein
MQEPKFLPCVCLTTEEEKTQLLECLKTTRVSQVSTPHNDTIQNTCDVWISYSSSYFSKFI